MPRQRRTVVTSPTQLPAAMIDEVITEMATRMSGSAEARSCDGLSFTFTVTDHDAAPARYEVRRGGRVRLSRDDDTPSSFHFTATLEVFDAVLLGEQHALSALLRRRIHLQGSLGQVRQLLRMMPSVHRAYGAAREDLLQRHADTYDFRF